MFFKKGLSEAQQQCLRWTLRVSYRDQKSTAGLPHVPSVTLCLSGVCTLEITFYGSYAEDIRKTCVCYWEGWVWGAGGGSSLLAFL